WPGAGAISIERGGDVTGDGLGDGWGFFLDPTPYDSSEFQGPIINGFAGQTQAGSPAAGLGDLYTVVLHELGHVVGFAGDSGLRLQTGGFVTNTGVRDGPGYFWAFNGPSIAHLLTSNNAGLEDFGRPLHTAWTGSSVFFGGQWLRGAQDVMNAGLGDS